MKIERLEIYQTSDDGYHWYEKPTKMDVINKINEMVDFSNYMNELLQHQIPKKVKYIETTTDGHLLGYCPFCTLKVLDENKFCYECGQALDWSD